MNTNKRNRFRTVLERIKSGDISFTGFRSLKMAPNGDTSANLSDPVVNYYRHRLKTHLPTFRRFALQSRSLRVRDIFAKTATGGRHDLAGLLSVLDTHQIEQVSDSLDRLQELYDAQIMLALASNIANTSRDDLDTHAAVKIFDFVFSLFGPDDFGDQDKLQYVEALADLERYEDVERLSRLFAINGLAPLQSELIKVQRVRRDESASTADWLKAMNALYSSLDMTSIQLTAAPDLSLMDRLRANPERIYNGPKVSVIMPAYSPGISILTGVRSLLEQSWQNIEIIIVDDASPDEFRPVFEELKKLDPRIQVLHQTKNAGAYPARNAGLALASGEYVTTHDDDDWSHPDKIALQVSVMQNDSTIVATTSSHIRTTPDMDFQRINVRAQYMQLNYSSLMFRREIIEKIGPWDSVNRGGDSEFIERLTQYFGEERILHISDKPLSFSRIRPGSLTSGEMSRGYFATSRLLYGSAFRQWHSSHLGKDRNLSRTEGDKRPFPVPTNFEPGARYKSLGNFDIIYVADFFRQSHTARFALQDMKALAEEGYRVGYIHLQSPQTNRANGFAHDLFDMQLEGKITQVSHNDCAHAKLLVVYDASIGMFADQITSSVTATRGIAIHHELPGASSSEMRTPTLINQALSELDRIFGIVFEAVGATPVEQKALRHVLPSHRVLADALIWDIHDDLAPAPIDPPRREPVVGFHTFDGSQYRWPLDQGVFESVYVSPHFRTRLYGSVVIAKAMFSPEVLEQVETLETDESEELSFLRDIDFWVYYPHDRFQDHVWAPALNAMQAGKVVILPPRLESIYGDAAIYTHPEDVRQVVTDLVNDPEGYVAQAQRGQDFVMQKYTQAKFLERISNVLPIAEPNT